MTTDQTPEQIQALEEAQAQQVDHRGKRLDAPRGLNDPMNHLEEARWRRSTNSRLWATIDEARALAVSSAEAENAALDVLRLIGTADEGLAGWFSRSLLALGFPRSIDHDALEHLAANYRHRVIAGTTS